ncbi:uncharacterized protein EHS24_000601 [Apiotrichum porosum]|uniref:Zinc finger C2H2 LYAR-type domain-containing protein n=1 Tax=Apiotrichum porosum TaxID=105984 RepID=A0A427YAP7_9TREE|nr:uncharacterized protein EHS24_000601 [Apiotrichum porosum]RSH88074.1 hypothetical protein EHS24_000601 [Apiotrichum porosum]
MVSFQCDGCADTVKKPALDKHRQRCWASFSCIDCSTTFHNQDYKSHTSCISEAEKYQGALYKGPRKGQQNQSTPASSNATPADSPAPSEGAGIAIHPSRMNQMQAGESQAPAPSYGAGRGRFAQRGGRGGFGRGGFNGGAPFNATPRWSATGENKTAPETGMRTWGSAPTSDSEAPAATKVAPVGATAAVATDAKKKRKGDKGGCGSKANSNKAKLASDAATEADEPQAKKRKRDDEVEDAPTAAPSDKTLKRLRKHMSKIEDKASGVPLANWLEQVAQGKEKTLDKSEVLQGIQVSFVDGRWQLSV